MSAGPTVGWVRSAGRRLKRLALSILVIYVAILMLMALLERRLVFFPSPYPQGDWTAQGLPVEDVWFESPDGLRLHGWYLPHPQARAEVLFCHGNAGNITHRTDVLQWLHDWAKVSVLMFDYRGYGRSQGSPSEQGVLADARAARAWLARRAGIAERDVVVMGESIGGAVAVDLATDGARALILECTFNTLPDVAAWHYPWLPVRWCMRTRLDSASKIGSYTGPLLQCHGDVDGIVPYVLGQRLFEAAHEPKQFITYRGMDHNDPRPRAWYQTIAEVLNKTKAGGP